MAEGMIPLESLVNGCVASESDYLCIPLVSVVVRFLMTLTLNWKKQRMNRVVNCLDTCSTGTAATRMSPLCSPSTLPRCAATFPPPAKATKLIVAEYPAHSAHSITSLAFIVLHSLVVSTSFLMSGMILSKYVRHTLNDPIGLVVEGC